MYNIYIYIIKIVIIRRRKIRTRIIINIYIYILIIYIYTYINNIYIHINNIYIYDTYTLCLKYDLLSSADRICYIRKTQFTLQPRWHKPHATRNQCSHCNGHRGPRSTLSEQNTNWDGRDSESTNVQEKWLLAGCTRGPPEETEEKCKHSKV